MTNEQLRNKAIEAAKTLLGTTIVIESDLDLTPDGVRTARVVKSRRSKKLQRKMIALYVGGRFFRHLPLTLESIDLAEKWALESNR
jgi:hypothetical protein